MKQIEPPTEMTLETLAPQCLRVMCPKITPVPDYGRILEAVSVELVDICSREFFLACNQFGKIVDKICPFDPPRLAEIDRLRVQVEQLNAKVEELTRKR